MIKATITFQKILAECHAKNEHEVETHYKRTLRALLKKMNDNKLLSLCVQQIFMLHSTIK